MLSFSQRLILSVVLLAHFGALAAEPPSVGILVMHVRSALAGGAFW